VWRPTVNPRRGRPLKGRYVETIAEQGGTGQAVWYTVPMNIEFEGEIIYWRGPAPFLFVPVPEEPSRDIKAVSSIATYGWGVIPVHARIGKTEWKTSLFPKDGRYLVPIRMSVQKSENLDVGDSVVIQLEVRFQ
jgi:hypothetical protein